MREKILIVDDDKMFLEELADLLSGDYGVVTASSGREALALVKQPNDIDLILLDIRMPDLNGIQVLQAVKKLSPDTGIVIMTGYGTKDVAVAALRGRADDFIEKTSSPGRIREIVEKVLQAGKGIDDLSSLGSAGRIEKVERFIAHNWDKKVTLRDAAAIVNLDPKYLSRIFREATGLTFNGFRLKAKIGQAKKMLSSTGMNVDLIADRLGYLNTESFIRIFKKRTGSTPSEYRKKAGK
jgi:YesN/AraC family two-component response regulator